MIYTIVADIFDFNEIYSKRDCHAEWQPLSLIPEDVLEYIESSRSEKTRLERFCAYFTLFLTVERFYKKKNLSISRTEHGKPYLVENGEKSNIHISISHTDGAIAVAISDEYELGVDLQINISEAQEKRLEKRFFDGVKIKNEIIDQEIYRLTISNNIDFEKICETNMYQILLKNGRFVNLF